MFFFYEIIVEATHPIIFNVCVPVRYGNSGASGGSANASVVMLQQTSSIRKRFKGWLALVKLRYVSLQILEVSYLPWKILLTTSQLLEDVL